MSRIRLKQDITVSVYGKEEFVDKLAKAIFEKYKNAEIDFFDIEWGEEGQTISGVETVEGWYQPAEYGPYGEGSGEEFEYEFEVCESDLNELCKKFVKENDLTDDDLFIEEVSCYEHKNFEYC